MNSVRQLIIIVTLIFSFLTVQLFAQNSFPSDKERRTTSSLIKEDVAYEGEYDINKLIYYRLGVGNDFPYSVSDKVIITQVDEHTYEWSNWSDIIFGENDVLYFQIDPETFKITFPERYNGIDQSLNGQTLTTVESKPEYLSNVIPLAGENINSSIVTEDSIVLNMVYGYYTPGSGPREFYCSLSLERRIESRPVGTQTFELNENMNFSAFDNFEVYGGGGSLEYSASLTNNNNLPSWLNFESSTCSFSGSYAEPGAWQIRVIASNDIASKEEIFSVVVYNSAIITRINNPPKWQNAIQFENTEEASSIIGSVADNEGYLYTYGESDGKSSFLNQVVEEGVFLAKHTPLGDLMWMKQFSEALHGSLGRNIAFDTITSHVYIAGKIYGYSEAEFVIPDAPNLIPAYNGSVFILKYDADGTFKYSAIENIQTSDLDLSTDRNDNVILTTQLSGTVDLSNNETFYDLGSGDALVMKYNATGELLWATQAGGSSIEYRSFTTTDSDNNIYLTGEFTSEKITIGNKTATFAEHQGNTVIAKINSDGETQWIKNQAGTAQNTSDYDSWPTDILTDRSGNIYIKGWHGDSTYFYNENEPILLTSKLGKYGNYLVKLDPSGNAVWARSINMAGLGFGYNTMDVDIDGSIYLALDYDNVIQVKDQFLPKPADSRSNLLIAKYDSEGNFKQGSMLFNILASSIQSVNLVSNQVSISGYFNNSLVVGNTTLNSSSIAGFFAVMEENIDVLSLKDNLNNKLSIYPNPTSDFLNIKAENLELITVSELSGKLIFKSQSNVLDLRGLKQGAYIITTYQSNENIQSSIVIKEQ